MKSLNFLCLAAGQKLILTHLFIYFIKKCPQLNLHLLLVLKKAYCYNVPSKKYLTLKKYFFNDVKHQIHYIKKISRLNSCPHGKNTIFSIINHTHNVKIFSIFPATKHSTKSF